MQSSTTLRLNSGYDMSALGLGTWLAKEGETGEAVKVAVLEGGYRHIDCASIYFNEDEVGRALHELFSSGHSIRREDLFITSKLWNDCHKKEHVREACLQTLKDLQLDYLDLYLIHFPVSFQHGIKEAVSAEQVIQVPLAETWKAMEGLVEEGLVRSIGVSNFEEEHLEEVFKVCSIPPAVNQYETHPYHTRQPLFEYCQSKGIVVTAHTSLGSPGNPWSDRFEGRRLMEEPLLEEIGRKHGKTPAQVLLRWGLQRPMVVIPKSVSRERILANKDIFDFELSAEDLQQLSALNKERRYNHPATAWLGRGAFPQ
ncbi:Aldo-keto reductase family 4 member C10 [Balamuthia mandrillaris]